MLAALAAALALAASPGGREDAIEAALRRAPPGGPRVVEVARALLGAPYAVSPLGEGFGFDPDPRFRLDAFDCMTFVETALALGSAGSLAEARRALDDVRYGGAPSFAARNHEVLSQWIPANLAKGWIGDGDGDGAFAGTLARPVEKVYTAESWARVRAAGRAIPGLPRGALPLGRFAAPVIATADVAGVADRIPDGSVAFVVREDAPDRATRVTHTGIVARGAQGGTVVLHATSSRGVHRVIEEPIERFLVREGRALPRWPMVGLAVFTARDNAERVRSLVHASTGAPSGRAGDPPPAGPPRAGRSAPPPPAHL